MKMHGVRMVASVAEVDANAVTLGGSQGRPGDPAVIGPGGEFDAGDDFDIFVERHDPIFTECLSIGQCGHFAVIKICQDISWVESVSFVVHFSHCAR